MEAVEKVREFSQAVVPMLVGAGWKIDLSENIRFVPESEIEWNISLEEGSGVDWFELQLGIRLGDERLDLRPVLAQFLREEAYRSPYSKTEPKGEFLFVHEGRAIEISRQRLNAILRPLLEIFGGIGQWPVELRLPKAALPELAGFEESVAAAQVPWKTSDELKRLSERF